VRRPTKIALGGTTFGLAVFSLITLATGSAQIALHAGFWITLVFCFWLEWRVGP
jgi:hypothetical protein